MPHQPGEHLTAPTARTDLLPGAMEGCFVDIDSQEVVGTVSPASRNSNRIAPELCAGRAAPCAPPSPGDQEVMVTDAAQWRQPVVTEPVGGSRARV